MEKSRFGVVGLGPIGGTYAGYLAQAQHIVFGVDIAGEIRAAVGKQGITVGGKLNAQSNLINCFNSISEFNDCNLDWLVIATKAYVLDTLAPDVRNLLRNNPNLNIILMQNGLENEIYLANQIGNSAKIIYRMAINFAGGATEPGKIQIAWLQPPSYIGAYDAHTGKYTANANAATLAEILTEAGLETELTNDVRYHTFWKTLLNAPLFALCSVDLKPMGSVTLAKEGLIRSAIRESLDVAKEAYRYDYGNNAEDDAVKYLIGGGDHLPSLTVDLIHGRLTENNSVSRAISEVGKGVGVATPFNDLFAEIIDLLERSKVHFNPSG